MLYSLVFLLCGFTNGQCITQGPTVVFSSQEDCEIAATTMKENGQKAVEEGNMEPHLAISQCVEWSVPS